MPTNNRIFLAHAREDKATVRKLYNDLKDRGLAPWLDEVDLTPGKNLKEEIPKAIQEAGVFLACLSSRSISKTGYVQNELRLALSALGERPPGSIFLVPVRLDDCAIPDLQNRDLGLKLTDIHSVDLWKENGLDRLLRAIELALQGGSGHDPLPLEPPVEPPVQSESLRLTALRRRMLAVAVVVLTAIITVWTATSPELVHWIRVAAGHLDPPYGVLFRDCPECPEMVMIRAEGQITMGSPPDRVGRSNDEKWQRTFKLSPFAMSAYAVTFDEWDACVAAGGCGEVWGRGRRPIINVSWEDAQAYATWLRDVTGKHYRLPTEAECALVGANCVHWVLPGSRFSTGFRDNGIGLRVVRAAR